MSTIAYKDGVIAGDTMAVCDNERYGNIEKVGRTENYLFGFVGRLGYMRPTYQWVKSLDEQGIHPQDFHNHKDSLKISDDGSAIIVGRDGQIWCVELDGYVHPVGRSYESIGSGGCYAVGAMCHGASAVEAVACASRMDVNSGKYIISWTFDHPVHCPNEKNAIDRPRQWVQDSI